jgi:hypothetical protein
MIHLTRSTGRSCPTYSPQECIDIMAKIWTDPLRHIEGAKGYKRTGALNALDGSEDGLICREAKVFWDRLDMPAKRARVICDVDTEFHAGRLKWNAASIGELIVPFPKTGFMDTIHEFQDDDALADHGGAAHDSDCEDDDKHEHGSEDGVEIEADGEHGHGSDDGVDCECEDAPVLSSLGEGPSIGALTREQAEVAGQFEKKLQTYEHARQLMDHIGDRSAAMSIARTIHKLNREASGRLQRDPAIALALNDKLMNESREAAIERIEYNRKQAAVADVKKIALDARDLKRKHAALQDKIKEAHSQQDCANSVKSFSPEMLGNGLSNGGQVQHRNRRHEVLDRLLARGKDLASQQLNDWQWFKKEWDAAMAATHGKEWGSKFAGMAQHILQQLESGNSSAVAEFMYNETIRVLNTVPALRV